MRAQTIREEVLGQDHPDVANSLDHRAGFLEIQVRALRNLPRRARGAQLMMSSSTIDKLYQCLTLTHFISQGKFAEAEL